MFVENFISDNRIYAIILYANYKREGIHFFTPNDFSHQLGYINRPKGYLIPPHVHNSVSREVFFTNEVLFIKSGKVRVDFYNENKKYLESRILKQVLLSDLSARFLDSLTGRRFRRRRCRSAITSRAKWHL